jgi:hypothetical protein
MTNQSKDKKHLQTTWEKEWKKAEGGRNKKKSQNFLPGKETVPKRG